MKKRFSSYILLLGLWAIIYTGCSKENKPPDPVSDIDGNTYKTVLIGTQIWMAQNLTTTRFSDGTEIPHIMSGSAWNNLTTPGYCCYNNDGESNKDTYGALYNGYAVNTGKLCPTGWHVPEKEEWEQLREFLGDTITGGNKLKESGTEHWLSQNKGADNSSGFSALPSGIRYFEGTFSSINTFTSFWSATETGQNKQWYLSLYYGDSGVLMGHISKKCGFSVRCVKD
jgi:uncharacterized protein (TIGR02145 family)